jgi:hypothetical protein
MAASGTLNDAIVFAHWKGRPYVRTHVVPHNPKTTAQTGIRAMMKFLTQAWKNLGASPKASWLTIATALKVSPFNAFVQVNLRRWRDYKGPTETTPAAETDVSATVTLDAPTGGIRNIVLGMTPSASTNLWGFLIFRGTDTITTVNWNNCIAIVPINGTNKVQYTDAPLNAGTYHYRVALCSIDGAIGAACADQSGTAT